MDLIIKNFDKLSLESQETLQDLISGETTNFILCDQLGALNKWRKDYLDNFDIDLKNIGFSKVEILIKRGVVVDHVLDEYLIRKYKKGE